MSRVLPILFNTDMVRAILDGRKTVTRRLIKYDDAILNSPYHKEHPEVEDKQIISKLCMPPYQPGDILYVRETWRVGKLINCFAFSLYKEQDDKIKKVFKEYVEKMPAAYDPDKVVEKFDKKYNNSLWIKGNEEFSITRNELIEIVNQFGVSDDVCEWKQDNMFEAVYRVCGGFSTTVYQKDFEYCPYCGKKIKVVE